MISGLECGPSCPYLWCDACKRDLIEDLLPGSTSMEKVYVIFDGPPGHNPGRFVEVEDTKGRSVSLSGVEWKQRGRYWMLGPFVAAPEESKHVERKERAEVQPKHHD